MGPDPIQWYSDKKRKSAMRRHRHTGRGRPGGDGGRDWSGAAVCQGPPESGRGKEKPEGVWPYQRLDFQLLASRTENKFLLFEFVMVAPGN